jgi:hypothetical protein
MMMMMMMDDIEAILMLMMNMDDNFYIVKTIFFLSSFSSKKIKIKIKSQNSALQKKNYKLKNYYNFFFKTMVSSSVWQFSYRVPLSYVIRSHVLICRALL